MWSRISSALKPQGNDNDDSDARSTSHSPPPDPFRVNATTYYTHQIPPTPPPGAHSRTASREEDIIWSLRTQLALQQEICAQFQIDLNARDELVATLTNRVEALETENDKRKNVIRSWKKKAADLEKLCRHLQEEADSSRQESMERSIMDVASGEALRRLHDQIARLQRDKKEIEVERDSLAETVKRSEGELRGRLGETDEANGEVMRHLHDRISHLEREKGDTEKERSTLAKAMEEAEAELVKLRGPLGVTDERNTDALEQLQGQVSHLTHERNDLHAERENLSSEISRLRAQLQQLQKDSARKEVTIVQLNKQRDKYKEDIDGLNIALESKQQELELVKRKHGSRNGVGPVFGRTNAVPTTAAKPTVQPPPKILRASSVGNRASSPPQYHRLRFS